MLGELPDPVTVQVPARASLALEDLVASQFGVEAKGMTRIIAADDLLITGRTYNRDPEGTYGQLIPGWERHKALL